MQEVEADTLSALKTVAEVSAAGALHADTRRGENRSRNQHCGGVNENVPDWLICFNAVPQ